MASYKIPLIKAYPDEVKYLMSYAQKLGAKINVDAIGFIGLQKDAMKYKLEFGAYIQVPVVLDVMQNHPDTSAPEGIQAIDNKIAVVSEDSLESKKEALLQLYQWAQKLNENLFNKINLINVPEEDPLEEQEVQAWIGKE